MACQRVQARAEGAQGEPGDGVCPQTAFRRVPRTHCDRTGDKKAWVLSRGSAPRPGQVALRGLCLLTDTNPLLRAVRRPGRDSTDNVLRARLPACWALGQLWSPSVPLSFPLYEACLFVSEKRVAAGTCGGPSAPNAPCLARGVRVTPTGD